MTASIENIVQHLFSQPSLQSVSVDELQQMTQEHPSFAAARFLLLKKMQDTGHPDFTSQLQKTSVYFNNPLWLQLLLSPMKAESLAWRPSNGSATEMIEHDTDDLYNEAAEAPVHTDISTEAHAETGEQVDEPVAIQQQGEPLIQEVLDRLRENIHEAGDLPPVSTEPVHEPVVQEVLDRLKEQIHEAGAHELLPDTGIPAEIATQDDQQKDEDFAPIPDTAPEVSAETAAPDAQLPAPDSAPPAPESDFTRKIIIETPMAQHDVLFEPYHTIDYFASQGIRLDKIDPAPKDKLGRQLKSFTEWLKSMKKLPQASIEKVLGENEESAVVAAASHSIVGKDVITEAMAEVFVKQGMRDKAVEIYRKLSLLNPAKSSYFADRINALKYS